MSPRSKHPCPCSGCGALVAPQHFVCAKHWGMVPVELKHLLNDLDRCEDKGEAQPLIARALDLARSAVSAREGLYQSVRELREEAQSFVDQSEVMKMTTKEEKTIKVGDVWESNGISKMRVKIVKIDDRGTPVAFWSGIDPRENGVCSVANFHRNHTLVERDGKKVS